LSFSVRSQEAAHAAQKENAHSASKHAKMAYARRYHVVGSYDGATMRLFVDGVLSITSSAQSGAVKYPISATFTMGAYLEGPYVYTLPGALDDVALWNRALAVDAVAGMFASQRDSTYFSCPSVCPQGRVSTRLCVGSLEEDCKPAFPCPKCLPGA
jgi:hypothetical protein